MATTDTDGSGQDWVQNSDGSWDKAGESRDAAKASAKVDTDIEQGMKKGRESAESLYGISKDEIGDETQDITKRRREAMDGTDPASTRLRESKNAQVRAAKAGGASDSMMAQIERQAASDIGQQEFRSQEEALDSYQKLIGNILGGTASLESSYAGLQKSGELASTNQVSSNAFGTVICTELHRQGYMTGEMLKKDAEHGRLVRVNNPSVFVGYIWLARPVVKLMRKSQLFTDLISIPAMAWARDMAGEKSLAGKLINKLGNLICKPVGDCIIYLDSKGLMYEV